jgi:hypothetical protein
MNVDFLGSNYDPVAGLWEHDNEISGFIKFREFLEHLRE